VGIPMHGHLGRELREDGERQRQRGKYDSSRDQEICAFTHRGISTTWFV